MCPLLVCVLLMASPAVLPAWGLQCDAASTYTVTPYLHYPTPQDCNVLTANYAANQCNYHCRNACAQALGLPNVPDISVVGSVNVLTCEQAAAVPGFSTGTVVTVEVCCEPPSPTFQCDADSTYTVTPYLHYPTPQDCNVLTANYAANQCNYHCRNACAQALGLPNVPDISVVGSVNVLSCEQAAAVPGFSTGTVITVEVCCEAGCGGPGTFTSQTTLLHYGAGSTCAGVNSMISAGTGCGYHCYKACGGPLPYQPSQVSAYVNSMSVDTCDDSSGQAVATINVCCNNMPPGPAPVAPGPRPVAPGPRPVTPEPESPRPALPRRKSPGRDSPKA